MSDPMQVPPGFTQVFPYIFAPDAASYLTFLSQGLGGEILSVEAAPDGKIRNAHVKFGDTTIMVSEANEKLGAMRATYYFYVENADAAMARGVSTLSWVTIVPSTSEIRAEIFAGFGRGLMANLRRL